MSILTLDARPTGVLKPLYQLDTGYGCLYLNSVKQAAALCRARPGGRRTLVPADRFPELYGGPYAPLGPRHARRFEDARGVAQELGVSRHIYLALNAWVNPDAGSGGFNLWIATVHTRIGIRDLRRLDVASGGSVRWVSPAGLVVPTDEQKTRSQ